MEIVLDNALALPFLSPERKQKGKLSLNIEPIKTSADPTGTSEADVSLVLSCSSLVFWLAQKEV